MASQIVGPAPGSPTPPFNLIKIVLGMLHLDTLLGAFLACVAVLCRSTALDRRWSLFGTPIMRFQIVIHLVFLSPIVSNSHAVALFHCIMRLLCCWLIPSFIILASNIGLLCFLRRRPAVHSKNALKRGFAPQVKCSSAIYRSFLLNFGIRFVDASITFFSKTAVSVAHP